MKLVRILLADRLEIGPFFGAAAVPQHPLQKGPIHLFVAAGAHVGTGLAFIDDPPFEHPGQAHPTGKIQINDVVSLGKAALGADLEIIAVHDPPFRVGIQKFCHLFPLVGSVGLHPTGEEMDAVEVQHRQAVLVPQLPGKGGLSAAAVT